MDDITEYMLEDLYGALKSNLRDIRRQKQDFGHADPDLLERTRQALRTASEAIQAALDASEEVS
jgi:hypothetical protein